MSLSNSELTTLHPPVVRTQTRRDIADLLSKSKLETARVRCEVVIGDEITVELLELLAVRPRPRTKPTQTKDEMEVRS